MISLPGLKDQARSIFYFALKAARADGLDAAEKKTMIAMASGVFGEDDADKVVSDLMAVLDAEEALRQRRISVIFPG